MCTLICYKIWLSESQVWSQILQVDIVPVIYPIFLALHGHGQVSVLPDYQGRLHLALTDTLNTVYLGRL